MLKNIARKIFGTANERTLREMQPLVAIINSLEPHYRSLADADFAVLTARLQQRCQAGGETLDSLLPEAFAICREAARRVLGMRHYDVQLLGGIALHRGTIAEMKTGEGKTLVATLAAYLNALSGKGVHIVTVNDYLAARDGAQMGELFAFLGMSVGVIINSSSDSARQAAYRCDITYGTNNEFGFDYLRDNMKFHQEEVGQRGHGFCIVDEVDSVLIDEARTPLIISGPLGQTVELYSAAAAIVPLLERGVEFEVEANNLAGRRKTQSGDYVVDEKARSAHLTEAGVTRAEAMLGIDNLFDPAHARALHCLQQTVRAFSLYRRDVDYVVQDGKVIIVDEFTGRIQPGRRWADGLHQAVEALAGVAIEEESVTLATVTFQNFFRLYEKLSGMTGTADTEAAEFHKIYGLSVVVIPTNMPMIRIDASDEVYLTMAEKYAAIVADISRRQQSGQPCLVGTASIERSEQLSLLLTEAGIGHFVLNAKQHEREAELVAQAGRLGTVTIATNMAGRGTDILLGGSPKGLLAHWRQTVDKEPDAIAAEAARLEKQCALERELVLAAGGLHIIGSERHESRRIDNQLRGRSGRQGDPGSSAFYLSLEDDLMRIFGGERLQKMMALLKMAPGEAISHPLLCRAIENAQKKVEARNFDIRKQLVEYDAVINLQREAIYSLRREIMNSCCLERFAQLMEATANAISDRHLDGSPGDWDWAAIKAAASRYLNLDLSLSPETVATLSAAQLRDSLREWATAIFKAKMAELGDELAGLVMRSALLQSIDTHWTRHLAEVEHLREGVGLCGYGQKDPKLEYKRESHALFMAMQSAIGFEAVGRFTAVQLVFEPPDQESLAAAEQEA